MRGSSRQRHRRLHRGAGLVLLALLASGSGLVTAPGSGGGGAPGTGDITDVFSCATGDCNNVIVQDGESLTATGTGVIAATTAAALAANPTDCAVNAYATAIAANGNLTCAQVATNQLTGTITDAQLANNYSGVGACGANQWASTLNDNAAPTCTQPAFSNISGSVTDAQVPDTITVALAATATALAADPTDCSANQYANAIAASGNLTCAQVNYSQIAGNQITLAGDQARLTFDLDSTAGSQQFIQFLDGTETLGPGGIYFEKVVDGTYTLNDASTRLAAHTISTGAILNFTAAAEANYYSYAPAIRASANLTGSFTRPFLANPQFQANNATMTLTDRPMYEASPGFEVIGTGTFGAGSAKSGYWANPILNSGTLSQWRGFVVSDAAGAGSLTTQIGLDIEALTKATTDIGIRSAAPVLLTGTSGTLSFDPDATATENFITFTDGTETVSGIYTGVQFANGTYTLNTNTSGILGYVANSTMTVSYTAGTNPIFGAISNLFNASSKISIASGAAVSGSWATPFVAAHTFEASGASTVATFSAATADFTSTPTFAVASSGAFGAGGGRNGFYHKPTVSSGTVATDTGVYIANKTGAGTLTTQVGIDVESMTGPTNQIGIRNASTTVYPNTNQAITAATDTINCNSTYKTITLPSGSQTLTSNPSIADGQIGQICILQNVGANTLTLTDATKGLNLAAATRALSADDTLTLMYGGASGDWVEIAWADN